MDQTSTDKQLFTDSFNVCWELLKRNNYYLNERKNDIFSTLTVGYGHDMYEAMMIIMNKIKKSNDQVTLEKIQTEPIEIVILNDTDNNNDECLDDDNDPLLDGGLNQKEQVDEVATQIEIDQDDKVISKKKKTSVKIDTINDKKNLNSNENLTESNQYNSLEEIHEKRVNNETNINTAADPTKNIENIFIQEKNINETTVTEDFNEISKKVNKDDSIKDKNKQIKTLGITLLNKKHIEDLQNFDSIKVLELNPFYKDVQNEMASVTSDLICLDETNKLDNLKKIKIQSNQTSHCRDNNQHCSNEIINNINKQRITRISTGSLVRKEYSIDMYTDENDEISFSKNTRKHENDLDDKDFVETTVKKLKQNKHSGDKVKKLNEISLEKKAHVVKLATENPTWSIIQLRNHTECKNLTSRSQIILWKKQLKQGGSRRDKNKLVNNWVYKNCINYYKNGENITNNKIVKWALEAKELFKFKNFIAGNTWLHSLKKKHGITGRASDLKININLQKNESSDESTISVPHELEVNN